MFFMGVVDVLTAFNIYILAGNVNIFAGNYFASGYISIIFGFKVYAAFNAAKLRGVPAQLLVFPDENHWVLKPQNGVLWQRTFFAWLDKWLKK